MYSKFTKLFSIVALVTVMASCQKEQISAPSAQQSIEQKKSNMPISMMIETSDNTLSTASSPQNNEAKGTSNPLAYARSNAKFAALTVALARTGLYSALMKMDKDYTLFAPSDDAFKAAGFTVDAIARAPKEVLTSILLYHVVQAKVPAADVPAGPNAEVKTLNGASIFVTKKDGNVFVNGGKVTYADVFAGNGVVHVINKLLLPPSGNIVKTLIDDPKFSLLVTAVVTASKGTTNVAELLSGNGPFTVFAPTNAAFLKLGLNEEAIKKTDPKILLSILGYHVIGNRIFSSDLSDGIKPTMLIGGTTTITLTGGPKIQGSGNDMPINIIKTDIVATNGVIHVVDGVILPK
ncbi:MAG: fasciclin domain-containing protein [Chitinophagaceae bacterium]